MSWEQREAQLEKQLEAWSIATSRPDQLSSDPQVRLEPFVTSWVPQKAMYPEQEKSVIYRVSYRGGGKEASVGNSTYYQSFGSLEDLYTLGGPTLCSQLLR